MEKSWFYLNGYFVICIREMEVFFIVSGINLVIIIIMDSVEFGLF